MSHIYQDANFTARCSEKTLQSNDEGFFLSLADNLAEIAGNNWIEKSFAKLRSDRDKLKVLYVYEPVKNALIEVLSNVQQIYRKKSSEIASARIKEADKLLQKNDLIRSLALYSQAVLRSQKTGENKDIDEGYTLSSALFGRSKVLIDMDKYDFALADIQNALKENLPEHHKGEAYFKLAVCFKAVNEDSKANVALRLAQKLLNQDPKILLSRFHNESSAAVRFQRKASNETGLPKLTGERNKIFPNAAKSLELKVTPTLGRHLVCKGKINIGDTIAVEAPYAACLVPEAFGTCCQHCFKRLIAPVGCPTCSNVAFCNIQCRDEALQSYHKYECKVLELLLGSGLSVISYLALRMVTEKELDANLELYKNKKNEPVFRMCTNSDKRKAYDFFRRAVMASFLLRCLQKVGYFGEEGNSVIPTEREITIGEILIFNLQMLQFNAHEIYEKIHSDTHRFKGAKINLIGVGLYPTVALFNHQCYPSVTRYFVGKNIVINSIKPLSNGEIVAENYGPIFTKRNLMARQNVLSSRYWFVCECQACLENWPMLSSEMENTSVRFRCPRKSCGNILSTVNKEKTKCSKCNEVVSLEDMRKKLQECVEQYHLALEKMDDMRTSECIEILKNALEKFHEVALPPHKETHWAEETLKACYADLGNTFEVQSKKK